MKSQVDLYVDLLERMLSCNPCGLASVRSLKKDIFTLRKRFSNEGLSFLTKTIPMLGKALDLGLSSSCFNIPEGFKSSSKNTNTPAFMQAYFKHVFDDAGNLRDDVEPNVVKHLRQVLFFAYKLEVPYTVEQVNSSLEEFVQIDMGLTLGYDIETTEILRVATDITADVFSDFEPKDIIPKHGPGAVATGERSEDKWHFSRLYDGIHQYYPYYEYFIIGRHRELFDRLEWYMSLARLQHGQAKVVCVPKDSRGPRLISAEPLEYQYIQQGLGRKLMDHLENHRFTSGFVNFTSQMINQELALSSSKDDAFSTVDLKDASDRVSLKLVETVFSKTPDLLRALKACRTRATALPDGRVVNLNKYAPMGSALCFPVESYVFWVLLVASISRHNAMRRTARECEVYVYGDDLIIPREYASLCIQTLESVHLRVNRNKCCIRGPFRESCGIDAFNGIVVTPIRLKKPWSGSKTDGSAYASYTSLANKLAKAGYVQCADYLWDKLSKTYGYIPYGTSISSFPCRVVSEPTVAERLNLKQFRFRLSRRYQRLEFLLPTLMSMKRTSKLEGWPRLLRNIVSPTIDDPQSIVDPRSMIIKRRWVTVN